MNKIKLLLLTCILILISESPIFSQQTNDANKKSLIANFRKLTGADRVNLSVNVSTDISDDLNALLEQDKEITEMQKQELKKYIAEANGRVDKTAKDFLNDQQTMTALAEEIIYQLYDKTFTEGELKDLIAFYQTPVGQKAAAFLPTLSKQIEKAFTESVVAKLQVIIVPKIQTEESQFKEKLADIKKQKVQ